MAAFFGAFAGAIVGLVLLALILAAAYGLPSDPLPIP